MADKKKGSTKPVMLKLEQQKISIGKYFQLCDPSIHIYTRASLVEEYRGIMSTMKDWKTELIRYTERGE